jgi:hypothetical protein
VIGTRFRQNKILRQWLIRLEREHPVPIAARQQLHVEAHSGPLWQFFTLEYLLEILQPVALSTVLSSSPSAGL